MARRFDIEPVDRDERLGEAIEEYLALAEEGSAPDPDEFAGRYPDMFQEVREALEGLALVRGLVGESGGGAGGPRLEAGRRVAGYRIVRELGRGGMGIVYEAVHVGLDRPVALKILGTHAAPDSTGRRRFLNEARTAAGLHHTHIVPVFDVGQVGGLCYYAMQRIEGCGLDRVLKALRRDRHTGAGSGSHRPLGPGNSRTVLAPEPASPSQADTGTWIAGGVGVGPVRDPLGRPKEPDEPPPFAPPTGSAYYRWAARVAMQAAEALAHAHSRGIIHRDVKPSNLLVDGRGTIWMADFGLARRLTDPGMTQADSLLGTPRYMSPEQAEPGPIDGRTDVYSLGATLFELLTLRPPFDGQSAAELVRQIVHREPPAPRASDPRIPRDLETIVLKCLAKRPGDRYATAAELAADLERFLNLEPVKARRISPVGRAWRFARRHPFSTTVTTLAALAIVTITAVAYARVVRERNAAITAQGETKAALIAQQEATRREQEAGARERKEHLAAVMSQATIVRQSALPGRRELGLKLMREAVALRPDDGLRGKLRDEAVGFLTLRDVVARPALPTGPARAMAFGVVPWGETRLAVLSDDDAELRFWDLARSKAVSRLALGTPRAAAGPGPGGPRFRRGRLAAGINLLAAIRPDNAGVRVVMGPWSRPNSWELEFPGRELLGVEVAFPFPGPNRPAVWPRLMTIERTRSNEPPNGDAEASNWLAEGFEVNLWELPHDRANAPMEQPLATLARSEGRAGPMVAVSPDGATIATAVAFGDAVTLWDARTGQPIGEPIPLQVHVRSLALGAEGLLAVADGSQVRLWDTEARPTPAALPAFNPHQVHIGLLRFSPDGTMLAVAGADPGIELWDTAGRPISTLTTTERVEDLAFSPDGSTLVAAGQGPSLASWSVIEPAGRVRLPEFKSRVTSLGFGPGGVLAMASGLDPVRFWWPGNNPGMTTARCWPEVVPSDFAFDGRGRLIVVDSAEIRCYDAPRERGRRGGHRLPSPPIDKAPLPTLNDFGLPPSRPGAAILTATAAAATEDGKVIAVSRNGDVWLYRPGAAEPLRALHVTPPADGPPGPPPGRPGAGSPRPVPWKSLALSPTGDRLYLNNWRDDFRVWAIGGDSVREVRLGPPQLRRGVTALALSADGQQVALGDARGRVTVLDAATGEVRARLGLADGEAEERVDALAFAPDGTLLAVGGFEHTRLWRLGPDPRSVVNLPGHRGRVNNLAFSPDGRRLATGGDDGAVAVWELDRVRAELRSLALDW